MAISRMSSACLRRTINRTTAFAALGIALGCGGDLKPRDSGRAGIGAGTGGEGTGGLGTGGLGIGGEGGTAGEGTGGLGIGGGAAAGSGGVGATGGTSGSGGDITGGTAGIAGAAGAGEEFCLVQPPIVENLFRVGTGYGSSECVNHEQAQISLGKEWTYNYDPATGRLPCDDNGWDINPPTSDVVVGAILQDPYYNEPALYINTIVSTNYGVLWFENTNPGLNNNTGWVFCWGGFVETVEDNNTDSYACSLMIRDDAAIIRLAIMENRIFDGAPADYQNTHMHWMDTTIMHDYCVSGQGDYYTIEVDGQPVPNSPWAFGEPYSSSRIEAGDRASGYPNSESYWRYIKYYNQGTTVPYCSSGSYYSKVYDLGSANNDLAGQGAKISFDGNAGLHLDITFQTRTGNTEDPDDPDGDWSGWQDTLGNDRLIQSPEARLLQVRAILTTSDPTVTPELRNYSINYRSCVRP
jgi:hypothetical protein